MLHTPAKHTPRNLNPNPVAQETMPLRRALQGKLQQGGNYEVSPDSFSKTCLGPEASKTRAKLRTCSALACSIYQHHLLIPATSVLPV